MFFRRGRHSMPGGDIRETCQRASPTKQVGIQGEQTPMGQCLYQGQGGVHKQKVCDFIDTFECHWVTVSKKQEGTQVETSIIMLLWLDTSTGQSYLIHGDVAASGTCEDLKIYNTKRKTLYQRFNKELLYMKEATKYY